MKELNRSFVSRRKQVRHNPEREIQYARQKATGEHTREHHERKRRKEMESRDKGKSNGDHNRSQFPDTLVDRGFRVTAKKLTRAIARERKESQFVALLKIRSAITSTVRSGYAFS